MECKRNFITVLVALQLCIGLVGSAAIAAEYSSTDIPKQMPEWGLTISTLDITDAGMVVDLNVQLDISHPSVSELDAYLIAPDGTRVKLFANVGVFAVDCRRFGAVCRKLSS